VVAVDGTTAILGWEAFDGYAGYRLGAALVFTRDGTTWSQQAALTPTDDGTGGGFGCST